MYRKFLIMVLAVAAAGGSLEAQQFTAQPCPQHAVGMEHEVGLSGVRNRPIQGGQAAYAAISEIIAILERDPGTDWSRVDLERLRQHLIDMDEVTLRSVVEQRPIDGGIEVTATGTGRTVESIRRMTNAHAATLGAEGRYVMSVTNVPGGVRLRITAARESGSETVARIRALGFIGVMTAGDHHAPHHLALARGTGATGHEH
ncbi:MAG TPA: hypothetical protein VNL98_03110 [Gemmatimonadales bacterium]|nr:hypothetical protein [Gemmatimonadales bacterium]